MFRLLFSLFLTPVMICNPVQGQAYTAKTVVGIRNEKWYINSGPTLKGRYWNGYAVEGLLPNSRMVQGIFDDLNPDTRQLWKYPDTGQWDAGRNNREFLSAMDAWRANGLLAFTLNLQGGSPQGYSQNQPWHNSAIDSKGGLRKDYMDRLEKIIVKADSLGMVVILGIFYFGQDERIQDEAAVVRAVDNTLEWLFAGGFRNVVIEVANECDNQKYDHSIMKPDRIHELIDRIKKKERNGYRFLVSTSFNGGRIPSESVIELSDFILLHGNGVKEPEGLNNMVNTLRNLPGYTPKPVVFNEDDHFEFENPMNHFMAATSVYASWGYFDYRMKEEPPGEGFQSVPVDWTISTARKKGCFELVRKMTGSGSAD